GHQADLYEHALQLEAVLLAGLAVLVDQAADPLAVADDLGRLGGDVDVDVGHAPQLVLQHLVGAQLAVEFEHGHVIDDVGEVDRRLDARVAAADYRHALALVQGSIAVRTLGDAAVAVLELPGTAAIAPARTGRQDHGSGLQRGAVLHHHFVPPARLLGRNQLLGFGEVHHVDVVGA